jgi:hypothetical protein
LVFNDCPLVQIDAPVFAVTAVAFAMSALYGWTRPSPPPPAPRPSNPDDRQGPPGMTITSTERTQIACDAARRFSLPDGRVVATCEGE